MVLETCGKLSPPLTEYFFNYINGSKSAPVRKWLGTTTPLQREGVGKKGVGGA